MSEVIVMFQPGGVWREQSHWKCAMPELLKATDMNIVKMLIKDKLLPD